MPLPWVCQKTPSRPRLAPASCTARKALLTPRYWWFLAISLIVPPRSSTNRVKFSTRSSSRAGSQVPRSMVSSETTPCSPSLLIFFQSLKCSHREERVPILLALPLERMMNAL